uniref:Uncharacterized protein n=1 Tax=Tanacetum cinerariifolium TaxID=118510 RepID=A0A699T4C2_TANCI|nr:hypothetical protein [Tanacetum cinerariifolium]
MNANGKLPRSNWPAGPRWGHRCGNRPNSRRSNPRNSTAVKAAAANRAPTARNGSSVGKCWSANSGSAARRCTVNWVSPRSVRVATITARAEKAATRPKVA